MLLTSQLNSSKCSFLLHLIWCTCGSDRARQLPLQQGQQLHKNQPATSHQPRRPLPAEAQHPAASPCTQAPSWAKSHGTWQHQDATAAKHFMQNTWALASCHLLHSWLHPPCLPHTGTHALADNPSPARGADPGETPSCQISDSSHIGPSQLFITEAVTREQREAHGPELSGHKGWPGHGRAGPHTITFCSLKRPHTHKTKCFSEFPELL